MADDFSGAQRRRNMARTAEHLGLSQRQAQRYFGWGRDTLRKAQHEARSGITCRDATSCQGRKPASKVSIDFMADRLEQWIQERAEALKDIRKLVLDLDNGPENSSQRSQWLLRMVQLAQRYGWVVVLAYYPPYPSKYNPIERLWGLLENYWRGELLDSEMAVQGCAAKMSYHGVHPQTRRCTEKYAKGVKLTKAERKRLEQHLQRQPGVEKWAIEIAPPDPDQTIT